MRLRLSDSCYYNSARRGFKVQGASIPLRFATLIITVWEYTNISPRLKLLDRSKVNFDADDCTCNATERYPHTIGCAFTFGALSFG